MKNKKQQLQQYYELPQFVSFQTFFFLPLLTYWRVLLKPYFHVLFSRGYLRLKRTGERQNKPLNCVSTN